MNTGYVQGIKCIGNDIYCNVYVCCLELVNVLSLPEQQFVYRLLYGRWLLLRIRGSKHSSIIILSTDYNECVNNNGGCDQICINTIPGHHCDCYDGFTLDSDNITCVANAECSDGVCTCLEGFVDEGPSGSGETVNCVGTYQFMQRIKITMQ